MGQTIANTDSTENRKAIIIFIALTFLITYVIEIFVIMPMAGSTDVNEAMLAQSMIGGIMFIPAVCALLTRFIVKEPLHGCNLMLALNLKGNMKYYALAWFGTVALTIIGTLIYYLFFPKQFDPNMGYLKVLIETQLGSNGITVTEQQVKQTMLLQILTGIFLSPFLNLINCFGEEWGWRGYLLPKMLKQIRVVPALIINGVIWGLWHAPLIIMGHNYGVGYPGYPYMGILAMCLFCVVMGVLLSYVTIKTGSCIPAIMGHGTINGFLNIGICFSSMENPYNVFMGPTALGLIGGLGFFALAVWLLFVLNKEEKEKIAAGSRNLL